MAVEAPAAEPDQQVRPARRDGTGLRAGDRWKRRAPLMPALVVVVALTQIPLLLTLYYSTRSRNLLRPESDEFVGLANYGKVLGDPLFRNAVLNTLVLTASVVLLSMALGIVLATLVDKQFLGRGIVRTLLITPFLVMPTAAALLWKTSIYDPVYGLLNWVLSPFGVDNVEWVSEYPMVSIIAVLIWQWTPFMMLIVLAGLQSQSPEILEAAKMDGASAWSTFGYVTLPHLRQFIELGILLGTIFIVHMIDPIFMITQGGPGQATTNLPYFIYLQVFRAFDAGEAAAAGVIVVIGTIVIATFALRVISNLFQEGARR